MNMILFRPKKKHIRSQSLSLSSPALEEASSESVVIASMSFWWNLKRDVDGVSHASPFIELGFDLFIAPQCTLEGRSFPSRASLLFIRHWQYSIATRFPRMSSIFSKLLRRVGLIFCRHLPKDGHGFGIVARSLHDLPGLGSLVG